MAAETPCAQCLASRSSTPWVSLALRAAPLPWSPCAGAAASGLEAAAAASPLRAQVLRLTWRRWSPIVHVVRSGRVQPGLGSGWVRGHRVLAQCLLQLSTPGRSPPSPQAGAFPAGAPPRHADATALGLRGLSGALARVPQGAGCRGWSRSAGAPLASGLSLRCEKQGYGAGQGWQDDCLGPSVALSVNCMWLGPRLSRTCLPLGSR